MEVMAVAFVSGDVELVVEVSVELVPKFPVPAVVQVSSLNAS